MKLETNVRPASDAEPVHALLTECGLDLRDRFGLSYWVPAYPLHRLREAVERGDVHEVVDNGGRLCATFTVSPEAPSYYRDLTWSPEGEPAVYVARLAVRPAEQGRGVGTWCMRWIQADARRRGFAAVRLDAFAGNPRLLRFYRRLGYDQRGTFVVNDRPFVCFERLLGVTRT